tara:strand:+ start:957 stop:1361 length:405 start_codon:yes stop_codon:yes gene_type:complete
MTDAALTAPFIERAYQDTYDLLVVVRDYISGPMQEDVEGLENDDHLHLTYTLSRITRQLTDVMAWLMLQKAVAAGELSREEAATEPAAALASLKDVQDEMDSAALSRLPLAARSMIDRTRRITALVGQLDSNAG